MVSVRWGRPPGPHISGGREREFSYDEPDNRSLGAAAANGWTVVSMARDWEPIFSFR